MYPDVWTIWFYFGEDERSFALPKDEEEARQKIKTFCKWNGEVLWELYKNGVFVEKGETQ